MEYAYQAKFVMRIRQIRVKASLPGLELLSGSVHVRYDVTYVTDDGGKNENADQKRKAGEHKLL